MIHHRIENYPNEHYAVGINESYDRILVQIQDCDVRQSRVSLSIHEAEHLKFLLETEINKLRATKSNTKYIAVDFDGTLAHYIYGDLHKYGHLHLGAPIATMVRRVQRWIEDGETVKIFTARIAEPIDPQELEATRSEILNWLAFHVHTTYPFEITNVKDRDMKELWDDRAVGVYVNTGQRVGDAPN